MKYPLALLSSVCIIAFSTSAFAGCAPNKSQPSNHLVYVKFENATAGQVNVIWYTFSGATRTYQSLAAGQSYVQSTYTKHVWEFTDGNGKCISTLVVSKGQVFKIH
jgi:VHL beta domain